MKSISTIFLLSVLFSLQNCNAFLFPFSGEIEFRSRWQAYKEFYEIDGLYNLSYDGSNSVYNVICDSEEGSFRPWQEAVNFSTEWLSSLSDKDKLTLLINGKIKPGTLSLITRLTVDKKVLDDERRLPFHDGFELERPYSESEIFAFIEKINNLPNLNQVIIRTPGKKPNLVKVKTI